MPGQISEWESSERRSFWIALTIALVPIPVSLLISWVLGSPPWLARPSMNHEEAFEVPAARGPH